MHDVGDYDEPDVNVGLFGPKGFENSVREYTNGLENSLMTIIDENGTLDLHLWNGRGEYRIHTPGDSENRLNTRVRGPSYLRSLVSKRPLNASRPIFVVLDPLLSPNDPHLHAVRTSLVERTEQHESIPRIFDRLPMPECERGLRKENQVLAERWPPAERNRATTPRAFATALPLLPLRHPNHRQRFQSRAPPPHRCREPSRHTT